jgi:hypothetical protein
MMDQMLNPQAGPSEPPVAYGTAEPVAQGAPVNEQVVTEGIVVEPAAGPGSLADELAKLKQLLTDGALTQAEFDEAKRRELKRSR